MLLLQAFKSIKEINNCLDKERADKKTIGFVPTMGALHMGHISLIEKAKKECDVVVSSIFVNPTQFNDPQDLEKYPRTLEKDLELLTEVSCDYVFAPEINEMYTWEELELKKQHIEDKSWMEGKNVNFGQLESVMEGVHRPGHFNGVAQVVSKLFKIVKPHKAYFGQKDFQQLAIIRSMVKQLDLPVEIVGCPIVREKNGLAMSSRNERLSPEEREKGAIISKVLFKVKDLVDTKNVGELCSLAKNELAQEPTITLEYFDIVNSDTLQPLAENESAKNAVACVALKLGPVRLIDNILLS